MMEDKKIRTRFAPSPTGFMHVGAARTALFAWLLARKNQGSFVLRIEDTDKAREVEGSIEHIQDSLKWLGLDWDEGPGAKGDSYGPYLQSDRLETYKTWAEKLVKSGRAYIDPFSKEELEQLRQKAKDEKRPFLFRDHRPENLEVSDDWYKKHPLRFKSDPKPYKWQDAVMGELSADAESLDDFIIIKADGYPTYNFAHIVDDAEMEISHVLRSQEFLSSTPKFLNLYEALGVTPPVLATLPFVMAIEGKKKLSKRDGAKDLLNYSADGYLPETLVNFLATLGWNDGTEQEVFTLDELVDTFSLDRVQHSPARFDEQRLLWLNGQHIRTLELDDLFSRVEDFWPTSADQADLSYKKQVLGIVQDRLKTLQDLPVISNFFFEEPQIDWNLVSQNKQLSKLDKSEIVTILETALKTLEGSDFDSPEQLQETLNNLLEQTGQKPMVLFSIIRLAVSWAPFSPALNETLFVLGKDAAISRLTDSYNYAHNL
jgi:glutamyl-tRNA synthetase